MKSTSSKLTHSKSTRAPQTVRLLAADDLAEVRGGFGGGVSRENFIQPNPQ